MTALPITPTVVLTLKDRTERIMDCLSRTAIEIGAELNEAKKDHPGQFVAWVERTLPFGIEKAERLMLIDRTYRDAPPELMAQLPPAWSALYELAAFAPERLEELVLEGYISAGMTVVQARELVARNKNPESYVDKSGVDPNSARKPVPAAVLARGLMRCAPQELGKSLYQELQDWMES